MKNESHSRVTKVGMITADDERGAARTTCFKAHYYVSVHGDPAASTLQSLHEEHLFTKSGNHYTHQTSTPNQLKQTASTHMNLI